MPLRTIRISKYRVRRLVSSLRRSRFAVKNNRTIPLPSNSHSSISNRLKNGGILTSLLLLLFGSIFLLLPSSNIDNSYMVVEKSFSQSFQQFKEKEDLKQLQIQQTRSAMLSKMQRKKTKKSQLLTKLQQQKIN